MRRECGGRRGAGEERGNYKSQEAAGGPDRGRGETTTPRRHQADRRWEMTSWTRRGALIRPELPAGWLPPRVVTAALAAAAPAFGHLSRAVEGPRPPAPHGEAYGPAFRWPNREAPRARGGERVEVGAAGEAPQAGGHQGMVSGGGGVRQWEGYPKGKMGLEAGGGAWERQLELR